MTTRNSSADPGSINVELAKDMRLRAAAIQIEPGPWDGFVWSNAASGSHKEITLHWQAGKQSGTIKDTDYPYEFSVPVPAGETRLMFRTSGVTADGNTFESKPVSSYAWNWWRAAWSPLSVVGRRGG